MATNRKGGFQYKPRTIEDIRRRVDMGGGNFDDIIKTGYGYQYFKPSKERDSYFRIMPAGWDEADHYGLDVYVHSNIGGDKQFNKYLCLKAHKGERCPICEAQHRFSKDDWEKIRPIRRVLIWLIDRDDEKAGPKYWAMPWPFDKALSKKVQNARTGAFRLVDDPDEGYDVIAIPTTAGKYTNWDPDVDQDSSPLSGNDKNYNAWLDYVQEHPLPELLEFKDPDHIEKVLLGQISQEDEEPEERPRSRIARNRTPTEEALDDEIPDHGTRRDPEPSEEEQKPARGRRRPAQEEPSGDEPAPDEDKSAARRVSALAQRGNRRQS